MSNSNIAQIVLCFVVADSNTCTDVYVLFISFLLGIAQPTELEGWELAQRLNESYDVHCFESLSIIVCGENIIKFCMLATAAGLIGLGLGFVAAGALILGAICAAFGVLYGCYFI